MNPLSNSVQYLHIWLFFTRKYNICNVRRWHTAILWISPNPVKASLAVQEHLSTIQASLKKRRMKVNPDKYVQFTLRFNYDTIHLRIRHEYLRHDSLTIQFTVWICSIHTSMNISTDTKVKHLGLILDKRLIWKERILIW